MKAKGRQKGWSFGSVKCLSVAAQRIRRGLNGAHPWLAIHSPLLHPHPKLGVISLSVLPSSAGYSYIKRTETGERHQAHRGQKDFALSANLSRSRVASARLSLLSLHLSILFYLFSFFSYHLRSRHQSLLNKRLLAVLRNLEYISNT